MKRGLPAPFRGEPECSGQLIFVVAGAGAGALVRAGRSRPGSSLAEHGTSSSWQAGRHRAPPGPGSSRSGSRRRPKSRSSRSARPRSDRAARLAERCGRSSRSDAAPPSRPERARRRAGRPRSEMLEPPSAALGFPAQLRAPAPAGDAMARRTGLPAQRRWPGGGEAEAAIAGASAAAAPGGRRRPACGQEQETHSPSPPSP